MQKNEKKSKKMTKNRQKYEQNEKNNQKKLKIFRTLEKIDKKSGRKRKKSQKTSGMLTKSHLVCKINQSLKKRNVVEQHPVHIVQHVKKNFLNHVI